MNVIFVIRAIRFTKKQWWQARTFFRVAQCNQRNDDDRFSVRSEEDETPDSDDEAFIDDTAMPELCYDSDEEESGALVSFLLDLNSSKSVYQDLFTNTR